MDDLICSAIQQRTNGYSLRYQEVVFMVFRNTLTMVGAFTVAHHFTLVILMATQGTIYSAMILVVIVGSSLLRILENYLFLIGMLGDSDGAPELAFMWVI